MEKIKTGDFVLPGDRLGTIEEFVPGEGTYEENSEVYAASAGFVLIDHLDKKIKVYKPGIVKPLMPRVGDIVLGKVSHVQSQMASVEIFQINKTIISTPFTGVIHISQVSRAFTNVMPDAYRVGDVIRARVIKATVPIQLSTIGRKFGVLLAFCSFCGGFLEKQGEDKLRCSNCDRIETRKVAIDYRRSIKGRRA